jgi:hypothetical protein
MPGCVPDRSSEGTDKVSLAIVMTLSLTDWTGL